MTTNEKIVKQGFELHGFRFSDQNHLIVGNVNTFVTLTLLTEVCRTVSHVVGFGFAGNDSDDNS